MSENRELLINFILHKKREARFFSFDDPTWYDGFLKGLNQVLSYLDEPTEEHEQCKKCVYYISKTEDSWICFKTTGIVQIPCEFFEVNDVKVSSFPNEQDHRERFVKGIGG